MFVFRFQFLGPCDKTAIADKYMYLLPIMKASNKGSNSEWATLCCLHRSSHFIDSTTKVFLRFRQLCVRITLSSHPLKLLAFSNNLSACSNDVTKQVSNWCFSTCSVSLKINTFADSATRQFDGTPSWYSKFLCPSRQLEDIAFFRRGAGRKNNT